MAAIGSGVPEPPMGLGFGGLRDLAARESAPKATVDFAEQDAAREYIERGVRDGTVIRNTIGGPALPNTFDGEPLITTSHAYNRRVLAEKILLELVRSGIRYEDESAQSMAKDAVELAEAFLVEVTK